MSTPSPASIAALASTAPPPAINWTVRCNEEMEQIHKLESALGLNRSNRISNHESRLGHLAGLRRLAAAAPTKSPAPASPAAAASLAPAPSVTTPPAVPAKVAAIPLTPGAGDAILVSSYRAFVELPAEMRQFSSMSRKDFDTMPHQLRGKFIREGGHVHDDAARKK